jgi:hypothetical protein
MQGFREYDKLLMRFVVFQLHILSIDILFLPAKQWVLNQYESSLEYSMKMMQIAEVTYSLQ